MAEDFIRYAFIAGELSPALYGRSDLEKHDLGLAECRNYYVDFRGGISSRAGFQFGDYVADPDEPSKMVPFQFAPNLFNTYVILFTHQKIRFIQDLSYVLENNISASAITKADPGVVTSASHDLSDGDWIVCTDIEGMTELQSRTLQVKNSTTDTFELYDVFGEKVNTSNYGVFTSGSFARIYTLDSPYTANDLVDLHAYKINDTVRLTHANYPIYNLVRSGHADWSLAVEVIGNDATAPGAPTLTPSTSGSAGVGFKITATIDGKESRASPMKINAASVDYASTAGSMKVTWAAVANARFYSVYRTSISPTGANLSTAEAVGWVGNAYGPIFVDANIIPDFTKTPPEHYNPFANGRVTGVTITNDGSSYAITDTVTFSASPTGDTATGVPVIHGGDILAVIVTHAGSGYESAPTVSFGTSTGSNGAATASIGSTSGNYPSISTIFQQRQIYAASYNQPLTVWGSRPGRLSSFDQSPVINAADSYEFDVVSEEVTPIKHLIPTRSGLVLMSNSGVWQLSTKSEDAVSPTNALADPQSYTGVSDVVPLKIDTDILYIEANGTAVRLMEYNDYSKVYASKNLSVLSNHLLTNSKYMTAWTWASNPYKLVWGRRTDGALLAFTIIKEEKVFAWSQHWTKGLFDDIVTVKESNIDVPYVTVKRYLNGRWVKTFERMASREFVDVEEVWCLDCALTVPYTYPEATIQVSAAGTEGGTVTITADGAVFDSGDVDSILRVGGGKFRISVYNDSQTVTAVCLRPISVVLPEDSDEMPLPSSAGEWSLDAPVSTISGLWHLEGEAVSALVDGNVVRNLTVSGGEVTLPSAGTAIVIGLPYTCRAKTLPNSSPQDIIEDNRKRVIGTAVRINDTRGLKVGASLDSLYPMKERTNELIGEPTRLQNGIKYVTIEASFDEEGQTYYVQEDPLPASILGFVEHVDVGDSDDTRRA